MSKTYPSKIGLELLIPFFVIAPAVLLLVTSTSNDRWIPLSILIMIILLGIYLSFTTHYTIDGKNLIVKSGFLFNKTIAISSIKKITETNSLLSAPAMSFDRLEISYGKFDDIIISPKEKQVFIAHLLELHPAIQVQWKK